MGEYILKMSNVTKNFGGVKALDDVSLEIKKGEIHCLAGENGSGKSTLIKVISGFHGADAGNMEIDGKNYPQISASEAIGAGIQVIYQDFSIFPNLTVMENLSLNIELANRSKIVSKKRMRQIAEEALRTIEVNMNPEEVVENLSVAEKQLIAIARAIMFDAKLIIMDEPTTALTHREVQTLFGIIRNLQKKGIAILFVSHKLDEVFEISENFTILRNGKNVITGSTSELDDKKFTYYMTGREFEDTNVIPPSESAENVLEIKNLSLKNGFSDVSFALKKGEILGLTGILGSGRSELMEALFGYRQADSGDILINGQKVSIGSVNDGIKNSMGYVPPDRLSEGLFLIQSILKNISVTKWPDYTKRGGFLDYGKIDADADKWIAELSVKLGKKEDPMQSLSGGNQQKVLLARWLLLDLKILILNSPTAGVDIGAKYDIHAYIRKLAAAGMSVIIVSEDMPEIMATCSRILIMKAGRLTAEIDANKVSTEKLTEMALS